MSKPVSYKGRPKSRLSFSGIEKWLASRTWLCFKFTVFFRAINLISGWDTYIDLGVIEIYEPPHPEILAQALDRCHEMGTDAFIFRNPFEQFCIPPKEFCQSVSAVSV